MLSRLARLSPALIATREVETRDYSKAKTNTETSPIAPGVKPVPVGQSSRPHSLRLIPGLWSRNTCALAVFLLSRGVCVGKKRVGSCANFHHCAVLLKSVFQLPVPFTTVLKMSVRQV